MPNKPYLHYTHTSCAQPHSHTHTQSHAGMVETKRRLPMDLNTSVLQLLPFLLFCTRRLAPFPLCSRTNVYQSNRTESNQSAHTDLNERWYVNLLSVHLPTICAHFSRLFRWILFIVLCVSVAAVAQSGWHRMLIFQLRLASDLCFPFAFLWLPRLRREKLCAVCIQPRSIYDLKINSQYLGVAYMTHIYLPHFGTVM